MPNNNKRNAILHLVVCIVFIFLGYVSLKANMGLPVIYFGIAVFMGFMSLLYFSRRDEK